MDMYPDKSTIGKTIWWQLKILNGQEKTLVQVVRKTIHRQQKKAVTKTIQS